MPCPPIECTAAEKRTLQAQVRLRLCRRSSIRRLRRADVDAVNLVTCCRYSDLVLREV